MRWPFRTQRQQKTENCRPPEGFVEAQFVGFADFPQQKKEHVKMNVKDDHRHIKAGIGIGTGTGSSTTRHPPRRVACVQKNEVKPLPPPKKQSYSPSLPPVPPTKAASGKTPPMHCITNTSNLKSPPPSAPSVSVTAQKANCKDTSSNELTPTLSPWRRRSIVTLAGADELERYQRSHHLGSLIVNSEEEPSNSLEHRSHSLPMDRVTQPPPMGSGMNRSTRSCPGNEVRSSSSSKSRGETTTLEERAHAYRASCQMKPAPLSSVGHKHNNHDYPPTISLHWSISQANKPNKM